MRKQQVPKGKQSAIRYDMRCHFNVRLKADMSRLNLPQQARRHQTTRSELEAKPLAGIYTQEALLSQTDHTMRHVS